MANRRDLHIGIDGDARGFDAACEEAEGKAKGLDRELAKLERQQAAQERVTARTTAAVQRYATAEDKAALAARKMGLEVKRAAEQAEKAQVRATAATEAAAKGLFDKERAAKLAARADDAVERAAIKAAEAQLAEAAAAEKAAGAERKAADAGDKHKASTDRMRGMLLSAGVAAGALAAPIAAAGLAVVGFAALAAPAIAKVVMAQADLGANWDTLDHGQKIAASSVHSLITDYKALAKSYEPDALQIFNGAVSTARGLLPGLGKVVDATKGSVADFATSLENTVGQQMPRLFSLAQTQGPQALSALGTTFDETATLAVSLVQDLAPVGMQLLGVANGGLRLLNVLEQINPHLVEIGATMLAVRGPANALGDLWVGGATKLGKYGKAATEAEKTTATLGKTVGSSPNLYIGAALAVGLLSYRWATAKSALDNRVDGIRAEASATKNSVATHQLAIKALGNESIGWTSYSKAVAAGTEGLKKHYKETDEHGTLRIAKAMAAERKAITNITQGEAELGKQYGITATQADALATAAGVDLSKGITGSGKDAVAAQAKIRQYKAAVEAAANPTRRVAEDMSKAANTSLLMKDRLAAVTDALAAYYGPASEAWNATTNVGKAFDDLSAAMKAAHGDFSNQTDKSRALRQALDQAETSVANLRTANLQTKGFDAAQKAAADQVQVLYSLVGNNKAAREQVDALALSFGLAAGKSNLSHDAFVQAARDMGKTKGEAEALWKAYKRLQEPVKLTADDADFMSKLHNAQGLTIDPKTGYLLGNGSDYFNKWLKSKGLTLNPKTGLFRGNNADYYNKWLKANGLKINPKTGKITGNTTSFWSAVHGIPPVVGTRTIDVRLSGARPDLQADGNVISASGVKRFANGGQNRHDLPPHITQQPAVLYGEPETGGEAYIPLGSQKRRRSTMLLSDVAGMFGLALVKPMADGGITSFADGGTTDIGLSSILSDWSSAVKPSTKAQLDSATKGRRTQVNQLAAAEDALAKARKKGSARDIAAAERRITAERQDLAAATAKLTDVESRYKYTKQSPATQLGSALAGTIKNTGAFIKNLTTLSSRGYGVLAQQLLAMGGTDAEKIAADAVKFSNAKLGKLQSQIGQTQDQQTQLANLPAILTAQTAIKAGAGGSWVGLLNATGLTPDVLAIAVKSMLSDLDKTAQGKALVADMHAHGYARGGPIVGPPGVDRVPLWGTAGEYVIPKGPATANRPLLDAIRQGIRVPIASVPVRGGDGASAGPQISQTFQTQDMDTHQLARESAREIAWMLR